MTATEISASTERLDDSRDGGYSLVEILVSLVLMGTVMVAVMAALFSAIHASAINDDEATLDAALGAAADGLGDALFVPCPEAVTPNAYEQYVDLGASAVGWPAGAVTVVDVEYWNPAVGQWAASNGVSGSECDSAVWLSTAKAMQKIDVRAETPNGAASRTIEVVVTDMRPEN